MASSAPVPRLARYTWRLQWPAVLLEGASWGLVSLAPFIVKRSLGAPERYVPLLIALCQAAWILAPAIGPRLSRADPQRAWRWIALYAHAPLLLIGLLAVRPAASSDLPLFLVALTLYYASGIAYVPHRAAMIRTNYAPRVRGRIYGRLLALNVLATIVASKSGGWLLDADPRWLKALFPLAAAIGFLGFFLQSRIRWRGQRRPHPPVRPAAWREAFRILRGDRSFLVYEAGFMLYGFGFLMSWPLLVLYAEGELKLSYDQFTWAQGVAFPTSQIAGTLLWGRLSDRIGIVRTTALAFAALAGFLFWMQWVDSAGQLVAAYALFGAAMAGVNVGWSLGPLHFAPDRAGHMYTAVHFSLVGVRSVIAPFLGSAILELFSFRAGFLSAMAVMLLAVLVVSTDPGSRRPVMTER